MNPDWGTILGGMGRPGELKARDLLRVLDMMKEQGWMDTFPPEPKVDTPSGIDWESIGDDLEEFHDYELEIDRMSPEELIRTWRSQSLGADPARMKYMMDAVKTLSEEYPVEYEEVSKKVGFDSTTLLTSNDAMPWGSA